MSYSVVLPNCVAREIDQRLDAEIAKYPDAADSRAFFRMQVIGHWAEFGEVPGFSLEPRAQAMSAGTAETEGLSPKDASAVLEEDAP